MAISAQSVNKSILSLDAVRQGGKRALARALSEIEARDGSADIAKLLDEAARATQAHVVGLTGPPGVGKSTLTNALIRHWRQQGESVGVVAVDPSSRFSHGALLGDRTRLDTDPTDQQVFVRSMAARDRLGGLSHEALSAIILMRSLFDRVLVESVGIGQSEADIAFAADSIILCIQPGSGDSLQFMKAGVMELPDIVVVTKADMGSVARRAKADVEGALSLAMRKHESWAVPVMMVSALNSEGLDALVQAVDRHHAYLVSSDLLVQQRKDQALLWLTDRVRRKFGTVGLSHVHLEEMIKSAAGPFEADRHITSDLSGRLTRKI
ncbi:methylmalonyl Co-A mutase-associated GTPase MeaB [Cohaesibacter celericrescens]|uniref:Methylmalonyl Co-A mutase-associated GTPase MeaB n=1 Tax=Cohaesibacter celericrescens TaxID=2067669 RepID=A0A2N5XKX7_9HYPH|nr:methylmalonyl Co-A mutase-associated GTPase MeaB [Cohaesibacter celericrescens]PLW75080.1 methylmalonyl Co-A mutase-associated GTPase MeaB [Cohaesibacter celericrescens]